MRRRLPCIAAFTATVDSARTRGRQAAIQGRIEDEQRPSLYTTNTFSISQLREQGYDRADGSSKARRGLPIAVSLLGMQKVLLPLAMRGPGSYIHSYQLSPVAYCTLQPVVSQMSKLFFRSHKNFSLMASFAMWPLYSDQP